MLGHASVTITERYAHLRVDLFAEHDVGTISLDLGAGSVAPMPIGQTLGSQQENG
jgi:hypothetical protein